MIENRAKWSMFALLLAYDYQLFIFFCCVRELLSQQNSLLLQLMGNSFLPWERLLWVLHLIMLVLWISVICSMEDLSFSIGRNFCLYQSAMLDGLWHHSVPIILFYRVTMTNIINITEVPRNILKLCCILLYYFQCWNSNTI